ncbi:MAG: hypothetical protein ACPGVU_04985 [Limisphaerales bacterium]
MNEPEDELEVFEPAPPEVTPELFKQWRSPRHGQSNPERMDTPVWEWLIRSELNAYQAGEQFGMPSSIEIGPGWCFDRNGQSSTKLPDGREILIASEHEDHYDPDFFIYNDVVVKNTNDTIEIYGYPKDVFPATDFHSATLLESQIILIGNLGYDEHRKPMETPVQILDLENMAIRSQATTGTAPGWIHQHKATLAKDGQSILIERGLLNRDDPTTLVENIDDWRLHISDWRWERLTERKWKRWEFSREDGELNYLWQIQQAAMDAEYPVLREVSKEAQEMFDGLDIPTLEEELGMKPNLKLYGQLYIPPVEFEKIPADEDEFGVTRLRIHDVIVRYVEQMHGVQLTVEGDLDPKLLDTLTSDLRTKLSKLENTPWIQHEL